MKVWHSLRAPLRTKEASTDALTPLLKTQFKQEPQSILRNSETTPVIKLKNKGNSLNKTAYT